LSAKGGERIGVSGDRSSSASAVGPGSASGGRIGELFAKILSQMRLLRRDPEQFGRNLLQYTDRAKFEEKILDVLFQPSLQVRIAGDRPPALNVLQPVLRPDAMTGGPNTIVLLAALIAECGVPVRIVTSSIGHRTDPTWFASHVASLLNRPAPTGLEVVAGVDPAAPAIVGDDDIWLATHWTTVQALRPVLPRMRRSWFLYFVQDFEPGFYAWSSNYALAMETYAMPHRAIINERLLAAYLRMRAVGRYAEPDFLEAHCIVFEPAVDRRLFHSPDLAEIPAPRPGPRRLLFYARPTNPRNMLGLGVHALRAAVEQRVFADEWEFFSIGSRGSMPSLGLGNGHMLRPAPWVDYAGYAETLRAADILLCPMLSPHTSYPVLEMAASGGLAVTNVYGPKTASALASVSPDIIGAEPTVEGFVDGLRHAVSRLGGVRKDRLVLPARWDDVLQPVAQWAAAAVGYPGKSVA
jgi:hypothetical protein